MPQCITEATIAGILALCGRAGVAAAEVTEKQLLTCASHCQLFAMCPAPFLCSANMLCLSSDCLAEKFTC